MRFDCIHCRKATTKPQSVKGAFLRMLTKQFNKFLEIAQSMYIVNSDKKNNDVIDDIPEHLHKSVLQISKESLQSFVKKKS